ncbi:MAG: response regulator [Cyclobacteriaceae bacterium]|nr:response regulator [Cyclobacteriaceae bacterium]
MIHKLCLGLLLSVMFLTQARTQPNYDPVRFTYYGIGSGLLSTEVNSITQDARGFLWTTSSRGINRFNGYEFENFTTLISGLKNVKAKAVIADDFGYVWIGTENMGLLRYHPESNQVKYFQQDDNDEFSLSNNYINCLFIDSNRDLWIGSWFGLSKYDRVSENIYNYPFPNIAVGNIYNYSLIESMAEDHTGNLWLGTWGGGLHKFNPNNKSFEHFETLSGEKRNTWVKDLLYYRGTLWIATIREGLYAMDIKTGEFQNFKFYDETMNQGYQRLLCLYKRNDDDLWIGSEKGLLNFHIPTQKYQIISDINNEHHPLPVNNVLKIFEDNHRGIWITAGGMNYFNYTGAKFIHLNKERLNNPRFDNEVHAFFEVTSDEIWVSTSSGIEKFNPHKGSVSNEKVFPGIVHKMVHLSNGDMAAISLREGLFIYNSKSKSIENFRFQTGANAGLPSDVLIDVLEDTLGNLWFATQNGLSYFKTSSKTFVNIVQDLSYSKGLVNKSINSIALNALGELYFINQRDLYKLEILDSAYFNNEQFAGIIKDTSAYEVSLILSHPNIRRVSAFGDYLWLCGDGLIRMNPQNGEITPYSKDNGIPHDETLNCIEDNSGNIWVTNQFGLSYLNTFTNEITNFFTQDGLQGDRFNAFAIMKSSDGRLYFGGNNGFNIVEPDKILLSEHRPAIVISKLLIYNQPVPAKNAPDSVIQVDKGFYLEKNVAYQKEFILDHSENVITFEFAALNFLYPENNEYAYFLEGVDKDWNYVKNRRFASYSNLPVGKWLQFRVKATNNNGIWSDKEGRISIYVRPPFWNTLWFKLISGFFIFLTLVSLYFLRIGNLKKQRQKLKLQVRERTREIEQQKREIERQNQTLQRQSHELKIQNSNISLFSEMGKKITASIELQEIFGRIYQLINDVLDIPILAIGEINPSDNSIHYWEIHQGKISGQTMPMSSKNRLSVYAINHSQSIFSNNIKEDVKLYLEQPHEQYQSDAFQSAIYIPLHAPDDEVIGVLVVKSDKRNAFEPKNVDLLSNIAVYVSIALTNSKSYQKIQEQSEKLKELDHIKTRFYTHISHEFRTPLSLIAGPAEEMYKNKNLTMRDKEFLSIILYNAKMLLRLVSQILDLSKLTDGVLRLETRRSDIVKVIDNITESFRFAAKKKGIDVVFKSNFTIVNAWIDQDKIEKIVYNLLSNAIKYTPENGAVTLELEVKMIKNMPDQFCLVIKDNGIGMSNEELQHIFEQYYRGGHNYTQTQSGAGIGLSLVKKLVELHKGRILVRSNINQGTEFQIDIPVAESYYLPSEKTERLISGENLLVNSAEWADFQEIQRIDVPSVHRETILLAEDNENLLEFMHQVLSEDFEVIRAKNGAEALEKIQIKTPDLVISDVMMPKMNGFELCNHLKSQEKTRNIPVILLTAKDSEKDQYEGLSYGADEYLTKPFNADILKLRISNLIKARQELKKSFESQLFPDLGQIELDDKYKDFIQKLMRVIEENIANKDLNIEFISDALGMSRSLLHEKIKLATGDSPGNLIRNARLNLAIRLLRKNQYNTAELAFKTGFSDPKYFSKCFKKEFGKSPKELLAQKHALDAAAD